MTSTSGDRYDALVIGGGPAGATAAILLASAGWRVALAERAVFPRRKVCGEFVSAPTWPLLRALGVERALADAGPAVRRVGLFADELALDAAMPIAPRGADGFGRAIGREVLDAALIAQATRCGAAVVQPCTVAALAREHVDYACTLQAHPDAARMRLRARIVIAAHGSWEPGSLPTHAPRGARKRGDLLAFKARFRGATLDRDTMPLLLFPGGYGGVVQSDGGRVSLSCCVRRDALARCRIRYAQARQAGDAVLAHIAASCRGVGTVLAGAALEDSWLAAGPIRPGMRRVRALGMFAVGNAMGEAHPIVAEGISMAIQSAWLLCALLLDHDAAVRSSRPDDALRALGHDYERAWRRAFAARVRAAAAFAALATHEPARRLAVTTLRHMPVLLTLGARWSGKTKSPPHRGAGPPAAMCAPAKGRS